MSNLFKKVACFTDIHFGHKHNSRTHNTDCEEFIIWFIEQAKARDCETCIFLGDWHHSRANINVSTLNYTMSNLERLSEAFDTVYFITGNHDLYYREKREIHSMPMVKQFPNIIMVDEPLFKDDVAILPWLVDEELKKFKGLEEKYVFGHFEIPGFKLNAMIEMPDHGTGVQTSHFEKQDYVFSGHFHKRQYNKNVHYIGNPFGHNYSDAGETDRGAMFLEWDGKPEYVNWEDGPRYVNVVLSELLDNPDKYLKPKTFAKVVIDVDINYEEALFLRETFIETHSIRELKLIPGVTSDHTENSNSSGIKFETVDQIVLDELSNVDSNHFNVAKLINIYNNLQGPKC